MSIATRSSAWGDPVARANGATPVARLTRNGPSTRILVNPVIPKLRVAAPAGELAAAMVAIEAMRMVLRMCAPSYLRVKHALRAVDIARSGLAHFALGAAGHIDVARPHDGDVGCVLGVGAHAP